MRLPLTIALVGLTLITAPLYAQNEKAGCNPESCGPKGTKVSEANAVKNLRTSFEEIVISLTQSKYSFSEDMKAMTFKAQATEEETLLLLNQASQIIRSEIIDRIPSQYLLKELKQYKPKITNSKQDIVSNLNKELNLYIAQVANLN